ncbi:MAG: N-acetyl-gamma-glutamyl-phosphate reductase [Syntrophomonadaceae bacterium]|nr:N-acetyl-gamma-glutamyl-phosphate reductase [Syntrophomonadaceae bacterium]
MYKIGIVGDGYTAADLLRLLIGHDEVEPVCILSTDNVGKRIDQVYPHLIGFCDLVCEESDTARLKGRCDAVFLALPHGLSVRIAPELLSYGIKCIDLGADFRLKEVDIYEKYYETAHEAPELLDEAVYGLPELKREEIKQTRLVANPGCFPTGAILPLAPLLQAGIIETDGVIVDSKSGVSGAGKIPKAANHFCEVNEGVRAYGVGNHRHGPEINQELSLLAKEAVNAVFTPHLVPMNRGILTTIYARLRSGIKPSRAREIIERKYEAETFIRVLPEGVMPHTKWVYGSNYVDIGVYVDQVNRNIILVSALDNLVKGASGQAIQNLNLVLGIEESRGLKFSGVHP